MARFSHGRGELRLGHRLGSPLRSRPEFVGHSVVPEGLVVLVQLLHVQRLVRTLLVLPLLLLFNSPTLRACGCPFHASVQLAFRAHTLQDTSQVCPSTQCLLDAAVPQMTSSLSESCSLILQPFSST